MPQTGATRYQKFLKSEKSKTKLKNKKDLPKGTNVTKTNFKVKKIVIKEQLKQHGANELLSKRKLSSKELLSRLNHFNVNSKVEALSGLKELFTLHPQVLEQNLGELINGISPMVLNIEKNVRKDCLKVLKLLLSKVSLEKVEPFFDILSTYLRSAMTHIDNRIQDDSLVFLDILLLSASEKMAQDFHKILPNFLDMISKMRIDAKPGRTLTVNLDSQITSVKWRIKVLHYLQDFLKHFVKYHKINRTDSTYAKNTHFINDDSKPNYYPIFNENYTSTCYVSCFSNKKSREEVPLDEVEKFKSYIDTLMPLLFETWLEVRPNVKNDSNIETVVTEDAAILLKHTLEVITLIWDLVQYLEKKNPNSNIEKLFCQKYKQPFSQHIVNSFPYVTNIRTKQKGNIPVENTVTDPKLVVDNLEICHLFIVLNPHVNVKTQVNDIKSVLSYIERTFNQASHDIINGVIIKILDKLFLAHSTNWTKSLSITDVLFKKVITAYFDKALDKDFRQKLFSLLCKIALTEQLNHFHTSEAYVSWLNNLPDILLEKSVTVQTVDIIHKFAVRSNKTFNTVIKPKFLQIIENLPNLTISDAVNDFNSYHKLISIFYWIKCWDENCLNLLEQQLLNNVYKGDHGKYIFDTLKLRSGESF